MLTVGSLFSGIGGLELGLERTGGFKTIWFAENDLYASAVLEKHWPGVVNYGNIKEINWGKVPKPDVLAGGFPCQDISVAGKGKGIEAGTRSGLWREYIKAIRALRPRYALIENVSMLALRGLDIVLADLAKAGYDAEWFVIRASDVGAPHRRERLFIIAYPNDSRTYGQKGQEERRGRVRQEPNHDANATNPNLIRIQRDVPQTLRRFPTFEKFENCRGVEDLRNRSDIPKPLIRRGDDGFPNRIHRTKCLGNAIVPQVAQVLGEIVLSMEL